MSKVTSKLQVTVPKATAEQHGIKPGDEIEFRPAGETIRLTTPRGKRGGRLSVEERLRRFDTAMKRQREREKPMKLPAQPPEERDWKREDLYTRGKTR